MVQPWVWFVGASQEQQPPCEGMRLGRAVLATRLYGRRDEGRHPARFGRQGVEIALLLRREAAGTWIVTGTIDESQVPTR